MILEHAVLPVRPGEEEDFEEAFALAKTIILGSPGCESLTLSRCLERPSAYLLLVQWRELEDHMEGFRQSSAYLEWRALLHHFYEPVPVVEHFALVQSA
ncbi:MAG TPA: antibiotic biosynthesis monooxygenase [Frankiaceae bacterium]|jgi:heme-degrading monooxygenase HmoA|nr:antibiotic biosynthesis monooxygenase [Frankiaceae bacterium]